MGTNVQQRGRKVNNLVILIRLRWIRICFSSLVYLTTHPAFRNRLLRLRLWRVLAMTHVIVEKLERSALSDQPKNQSSSALRIRLGRIRESLHGVASCGDSRFSRPDLSGLRIKLYFLSRVTNAHKLRITHQTGRGCERHKKWVFCSISTENGPK